MHFFENHNFGMGGNANNEASSMTAPQRRRSTTQSRSWSRRAPARSTSSSAWPCLVEYILFTAAYASNTQSKISLPPAAADRGSRRADAIMWAAPKPSLVEAVLVAAEQLERRRVGQDWVEAESKLASHHETPWRQTHPGRRLADWQPHSHKYFVCSIQESEKNLKI